MFTYKKLLEVKIARNGNVDNFVDNRYRGRLHECPPPFPTLPYLINLLFTI